MQVCCLQWKERAACELTDFIDVVCGACIVNKKKAGEMFMGMDLASSGRVYDPERER